MGAVIAAAMAVLLIGLGAEAVFGDSPGWLIAASAILAGGPILLAALRTVPTAVRLGRREGSPADQTRLARAVLRDHIVCAVGMAAFLAVWTVRWLN